MLRINHLIFKTWLRAEIVCCSSLRRRPSWTVWSVRVAWFSNNRQTLIDEDDTTWTIVWYLTIGSCLVRLYRLSIQSYFRRLKEPIHSLFFNRFSFVILNNHFRRQGYVSIATDRKTMSKILKPRGQILRKLFSKVKLHTSIYIKNRGGSFGIR